jgi:hypothetical protein
LLDIGIAQRIFKRRERVAVHADAVGKEYAFGKWKHRSLGFLLTPHVDRSPPFVAAFHDRPVTLARTNSISVNIL